MQNVQSLMQDSHAEKEGKSEIGDLAMQLVRKKSQETPGIPTEVLVAKRTLLNRSISKSIVVLAALAFGAIIVAVAILEVAYSKSTTFYEISTTTDVLSGILGAFSIASAAVVLRLYRCYDSLATPFNPKPVWRTLRRPEFLVEVIVCLLHCPVFVRSDVTDALSFNVIVFLRGYTFVKLLRFHPSAHHVRPFFLAMPRGAAHMQSSTVAIKSSFRDSPWFTMLATAVYLVPVLAYSLIVLERAREPELESFENGLWLVVVTMTTVGYGDISASTSGGRAVSILTAVYGITLMTCLLSALLQALELDSSQSAAEDQALRGLLEAQLKRDAGRVIAAKWRARSDKSEEAGYNEKKASTAFNKSRLRHREYMLATETEKPLDMVTRMSLMQEAIDRVHHHAKQVDTARRFKLKQMTEMLTFIQAQNVSIKETAALHYMEHQQDMQEVRQKHAALGNRHRALFQAVQEVDAKLGGSRLPNSPVSTVVVERSPRDAASASDGTIDNTRDRERWWKRLRRSSRSRPATPVDSPANSPRAASLPSTSQTRPRLSVATITLAPTAENAPKAKTSPAGSENTRFV